MSEIEKISCDLLGTNCEFAHFQDVEFIVSTLIRRYRDMHFDEKI
jgi:hypothetical protein